jgi:DNA-binding winged helix-turn-helix (wHTH) protein
MLGEKLMGEKRIFRFGVFEVDAGSGELRKAGLRVRLQEQPFQVLLLLIEHPGEIVAREEMRRRLWPAGTFVDFDHGLSAIINKLRDALGDSAANPRFIETLAKRGYRFLVPVERMAEGRREVEDTKPLPPEQIKPAAPSHPLAHPLGFTNVEEVPSVSPAYVRTLFLFIQVMYLSFYIRALARLPVVQEILERALGRSSAVVILILSASIGIPLRLYLFSAAAFDVKDFARNFLRLFPVILTMDWLWALSPFLLERQIGAGLALGVTAALVYVPFGQRTLALMRQRSASELDQVGAN